MRLKARYRTHFEFSKGVTLIEIAVVLALSAILIAGSLTAVSKFSSKAKISAETEKIVDQIWNLRSRATQGQKNPCIDFPTSESVRTYLDTSTVTNGFGAGDTILTEFYFRGGVKSIAITGGSGTTHSVCFESRGTIGTATSGLEILVGLDSATHQFKKIRLLPSTGIAKVL